MSEQRRRKIAALERASWEIAAGRLWRAKEILAGTIASRGYSPELFAAYGRVLARMQDSREAGKYLFLSGRAEAAEAATVELFLAGMRGRPARWIYSQFPGSIRRVPFRDFPAPLQEALRQHLGFPPNFGWECPPGIAEPTPAWQSVGVTVIGFSFLGLIVLGLLHGCYVVGDWIVH